MRYHCNRIVNKVPPSYFKLHVRWLSSLTPVTYFSKLLGFTASPPSCSSNYFVVHHSNGQSVPNEHNKGITHEQSISPEVQHPGRLLSVKSAV
ncbi:hypothetical protein D6029_07295 [Buttiauxella izardii]|uniref:Uncharacterized protein n=1 Tax=Buttiauxella izardii TaxID=82991 RepID=A0A3A5JUX2_9ENTR|nr:hypothetical protein D6029_07295 [Buttiauxella izardii]